jgi:methyl-accepting chemotaxis protein
VNDLIAQFALASEEQSKGISQVTLAIAELDRVTQQNASLVQEVAASAGSLNGRTEILASVISHFTFPDATPPQPGQPAAADAQPRSNAGEWVALHH